jgi:Contractile injection system tube protein
MAQQLGKFVLVNLVAQGTFEFQFFPQRISTDGRTNWPAQDVTTGAKPLFYMNREPRRITISDLYLDKSDRNESLKPQIDALFALQAETAQGTPPLLLAIWGDRQERVVLEELTVDEEFFAPSGVPIRARVSLTLTEVQADALPARLPSVSPARPVFGPQP